MKIGDKVRFLREVGGGIVRGFQGKEVALVEDADGFEIPMRVADCVVVEEAEEPRYTAAKKTAATAPAKSAPQPKEEEPAPREVTYRPAERKEGELLNVLLAFVPVDIKAPTTTTFEAYLVNDSNYFVYYTYLYAQGTSWRVRSHGLLEPNTKYFMEEFGREELNDLEHVCLQLLPFKQEKGFLLKQAANVQLRIDGVKFYKTHLFGESPFFDEPSLCYPVVKDDIPVKEMFVDAEELKTALLEKKQADRPRSQPLPRKQRQSDIVEVDLHAHELLETTAGMDNAAILEYQLEAARKTLDEHKAHKGQKIVFVHGKGEGVLRSALLKMLRSKYPAFLSQDASFREYGFGATLVVVK